MIFQLRSWCRRGMVFGCVLVGLHCVPADAAHLTDLLNIDFGIGSVSAKKGPAAVGLTEDDFWNLYSRDGDGGTLGLLRWSDNRVSTISATVVNAPGAWGNGSSDPMFGVYLYPAADQDIFITLHQLEQGEYRLLVYAHGLLDEENSAIEVSAGGIVQGPLNTTTQTGWNTIVWEDGQQYVTFDSISVHQEGEVSIRIRPGTRGLAMVNGLQLLRVHAPGPETIQLWNIDFSGHANPSVRQKTGPAAIGVDSADFWNLYSRDDGFGGFLNQNALSNLKLFDRTVTTAGLLVSNAPGLWISDHPDPMLDSYLYPFNGGNVVMAVTNLPAGLYDVYFYAHGLLDDENGVVQLESADVAYGTKTTTTSATWRSETWEEGQQYVRFQKVLVTTEAPIIITVNPGTTGLAVINGMQLIRLKSPSPAPTGMVAWWRGEGDAEDAVGRNDGEVIGAVDFTEGYVGQAFRLDGVTGRVEVPASPSLAVSSFTLEAWVKPEDVGEQQPILEYAADSGSAGVHLWLSVAPGGGFSVPGTLFANVRDEWGGNRLLASDPGRIEAGVWSHVALTYDPATGLGNLYLNGDQVAEEDLGTFTPGTALPFHIGYRPAQSVDGAGGSRFAGWIDEVAVYNRALESEEITAIYDAGRDGRCQQVPVTLTTIASGNGWIERSPEAALYPQGTEILLTAIPEPGFVFVGWSGDVVGEENPLAFTLDRHTTIVGTFQVTPPVVTRTLRVDEVGPRQEGQRVRVPLVLDSPGDVGGMTFVLQYDPEYLSRPEVIWAEEVTGSRLVNNDQPSEIRATFALPGIALPAGEFGLAQVRFRARSVPHSLRTPLRLEVLDAADAAGNLIFPDIGAQGGLATILVRRLIGDNNANHRLDVGDATVIQRLLAGFEFIRPWDVTGNDLNQNEELESGDVIRVLRAAAGIDPQPMPQGWEISSGESLTTQQSPELDTGPASGTSTLSLSAARGAPGDLIIVQVGLAELSVPPMAVALQVEYPVEALRLNNEEAHRVGAMVPADAAALWNLAPHQTDYEMQSGRLTLGVSHAASWPQASGVLAELTFEVQSGQTASALWPIRVKAIEVTSDGFELFPLSLATIQFIGRDPFPAIIEPRSVGLTPEGFGFTVTGELGINYRLEVSSDLIEWFPLRTFLGTGYPEFIQENGTSEDPHRFYRVQVE